MFSIFKLNSNKNLEIDDNSLSECSVSGVEDKIDLRDVDTGSTQPILNVSTINNYLLAIAQSKIILLFIFIY